jgi:hypothetical protein
VAINPGNTLRFGDLLSHEKPIMVLSPQEIRNQGDDET